MHLQETKQFLTMPNHARGHEENRKIVCLTCLKKCTRQITSFQAERLSKIYGINFDLGDARVPQGICDTCRTIMKERDEGKEVVLPSLYDFKSIRVRLETRGENCDCLICRIGRLKLNEKHPLDVSRADEKGPTVCCNDCLSPIGKGFPHNCNQPRFCENLKGLAAQDEKVAEQIAAKVIASKTASPKDTVRLSKPSGGPPLPLTPGASFNNENLK